MDLSSNADGIVVVAIQIVEDAVFSALTAQDSDRCVGSATSTIWETKSDAHYFHINGTTNSYQLMGTETLMFVHKAPSAGSNTYYLSGKVQSGVGLTIQTNSSSAPFSTKLTEIQK